MSFTLCTSGAATIKAGTDVSSTIKADSTALNQMSDHAEGRITAETRRTWVDDYANLSTEIKGILSDVASSLIAMDMMWFNNKVYQSAEIFQTGLDIHIDRITRGLSFLRSFKSNEIKSVS